MYVELKESCNYGNMTGQEFIAKVCRIIFDGGFRIKGKFLEAYEKRTEIVEQLQTGHKVETVEYNYKWVDDGHISYIKVGSVYSITKAYFIRAFGSASPVYVGHDRLLVISNIIRQTNKWFPGYEKEINLLEQKLLAEFTESRD